MTRRAWLLALAIVLGFGLAAIWTSPRPAPSPSPSPTASLETPGPSVAPSGSCAATDQDQYVYHPARLVVLAPCIRITGTVAAIRNEADGDLHVLVALDPAYASLLTPANANELGDLVVEPVCVKSVTQTDAIAICKSDSDPTSITGLSVGLHVWMEGRYVTDSDHGGWAELHPLYRWGQ